MKSYPAYKHSGVPWLGEIPEHWGTIYPKALFAQRKDRAEKGMRQLTASQNHGVIYQDDYMKLTGSRVVTVMKDFDILKRVEVGDFVISMRSFQGGLEYSNLSGSISSAYVMLTPRTGLIHAPFFKWLFKSYGYIKALQSTSNLVRDGQAMRYANFIQVRLPLVPLDEQAAIASYLDRKCGEIDEMVRRRQAIIERLRELKQALIAKAVTKGLHPDVPMKDSGISWLGQIPEHWKIERLKQFCFQIKDRNSDLYTSRALQFRYGEIIEKPNNDATNTDYLKTISDYTLIRPNYIIINGLNLNYDFVTQRVAISNMDGAMTSAYIAMGVHDNIIPRYLSYLLKSLDAKKMLNGMGKGIRITLTFKILSQLWISSPTLPEQAAIVAYLDKKCAAIDELISRHGQIVEKLKELKASAIAHVVTGKIDIREGA